MDARVVQTVRERVGSIIDSQTEVGGYPVAEATYEALDIPETGIQAWLDSFIHEPQL